MFRQVTSPLAGFVMTVMPSYATASSMYSMPLVEHASASSCSIGREASLTSVSPSQNRTKPSPVPGPSTVIWTFGDTSSLKSSATRLEIGSTVDEPEIAIVPVRSGGGTAAPVVPDPPSSPPQAAATSDSDVTAASSTSHFLRFRIQLLLRRPNGPVVAGTLPTRGERPPAPV